MPEMPHIYMPDPDNLPDGLVLSPAVEAHYRALPKTYKLNWDSYGAGGDLEIPEQLPVAKVSGVEKANIDNYAEWVQTLDRVYESLALQIADIADIPKKAGALCDEGRDGLRSLIDNLYEMAQINPKDVETIKALVTEGVLDASAIDGGGEISENDYAMALVTTATVQAETVMSTMNGKFTALAEDVSPPPNTAPDPEKKPSPAETPDKAETPHNADDPDPSSQKVQSPSVDRPVLADDTTTDAPLPETPPAWDWDGGNGVPATSAAATAATALDPASATSDSGTPNAVLASAPTSNSPADSASAPATGPASTAATTQGFSPAAYALPLAMRQGMANLAASRQQLPGSVARSDQVAAGASAPPVQGPRSGTSATAASASATAPSASHDSQPARGAQSTQAGQPAPASTSPNTSGASDAQHRPAATAVPAAAAAPGREPVVYTFPDGRSQNVSPVVRQALDAAFGNAAGTDARRAYEQTVARLPEGEEFGTPVDPNQLVTGDIATWEERSAVVVALGETVSPQLEVIVEGELRLFDAEMSDRQGKFGHFTGFVHPEGIDLGSADTARVVPVGHSGADISVPV